MALEQFIEKRFAGKSRVIIDQANAILAEYEPKGLVLTLRQLYYQFVARGHFANVQSNYKRLGNIMSDARLAGLVDWDMMEDITRSLKSLSSWRDPQQILDSVGRQYREDAWAEQDCRVEVWVEKDGLQGVIARACTDCRVDYFSCHGYASQSAQYEAGRRFAHYIGQGQEVVVLHLGDHDPSGIDMTRDNGERLDLFTRDDVQVTRLALNMNQVKRFNPPPNPTKETDSRTPWYRRKYGTKCWEIDALNPDYIDGMLRTAIAAHRDDAVWAKSMRREESNRRALAQTARHWDAVRKFVRKIKRAA